MKKRNSRKLILVCVIFLFSGCKAVQKTEMPEASIQKEEQGETSDTEEVRAVFTEEAIGTEGIGEGNVQGEAGTEVKGQTEGGADASGEAYDYVAFGNSVTCSRVAEGLWWGNWGMAATSAEKDYIHLISKWLQTRTKQPVKTMVLDIKKWEVAKDRDAALSEYQDHLGAQTDLVTIQTGENIKSKETLDMDYLNLIKLIKEKAPNAQILMLGELLWPAEDIEAAKLAACEAYGVTFVDMEEYLNGYNEFYRSKIGTKVFGEDGKKHTIVDEAVAAHPNDEGMACIAKQVIEQITVQN